MHSKFALELDALSSKRTPVKDTIYANFSLTKEGKR